MVFVWHENGLAIKNELRIFLQARVYEAIRPGGTKDESRIINFTRSFWIRSEWIGFQGRKLGSNKTRPLSLRGLKKKKKN